MLKWVFLDLGNVLFIDEQGLFRRYEALHDLATSSGSAVSFEELMERRQQLVIAHKDPLPFITLADEVLGERGWQKTDRLARTRLPANWRDRNILVSEAPRVLGELAKEYRLALAANQNLDCRQALAELGLLNWFSVVGISAERGVEKPSPQFYQALLAEAGCQPKEAMMVGDRFDNDIAPAKRLGMTAVWVELDLVQSGYTATSPREQQYMASLRRAPSRGKGMGMEGIEADARITRLESLPQTIHRLCT